MKIYFQSIFLFLLFVLLDHSIAFLFSDLNDLSNVINKKERPKIIHAPRNASVLANQQMLFICISEGNPKPKVTWLYNGKPQLPERYNIIRDSVLHLSSARSEDNGAIVSCVCRNVMGSEDKSASIKVYNDINGFFKRTLYASAVPKGFPKYFGKSSITVSQKNSNVTLECLVFGQSKITVVWFKDFFPLDLRSIRYQMLDGKNLFILKTMESDTGKYQCMAINEFGSMISPAKSLMIRVSRFSPHFVYVSPDQFIRTGSSVKLKCSGEGSPTPHVFWICGNTKLTGLNGDKGQTENIGSIEMVLSDISESLNCTCVAKTKQETANHTVHIIVKNLPVAPTIVRISEISHRSCLLTWKYQSTTTISITSFIVFYIPTVMLRIEQPLSKDIDISSKEIQKDFNINTKIMELKPYTNYSLWLVTNGVEGVSEPSKIHSFQTLETEPTSAPRSVSIALTSETSVRVKWKPPIETNGEITLYQVFYTKSKEDPLTQWSINSLKIVNEEKENDKSVEIYMLDRNTMYYFCVNSRNSAGEGPSSQIVQKFINDDEIYQLKNLTMLLVQSKSADILWKIDPISKVNAFKIVCIPSTSHPSQANEVYKIFLNKLNKQLIYFTKISNLSPNTPYIVEIIPIFNNTAKSSMKIRFTTRYHDEKELIKAISISQESIMISIPHSSMIISPRIVVGYFPYTEGNKSLTKSCFLKTDNSCHLTNLVPETLYQLNIAYNGMTVKRYVETWAKDPDPVQDFKLELINPKSQPYIKATWKYLTGPLPIFEITYSPLDAPVNSNFSKYAKTINITDLKYETDPATHVMGSTVQFSIRAIFNFQTSEPVQSKIKFPEGVPKDYPKSFKVHSKFSDENSFLSWTPISWENQNGKLTSSEMECFDFIKENLVVKRNTTENQIEFSKNLTNKKLQCRMRSRTKAGAGPWSPFVLIDFNHSEIEPPTQISILKISSCCFKISWKWQKEFLNFYNYFLIFFTRNDQINHENFQFRTRYASSLFYVAKQNEFDWNKNYSVTMQSVTKSGALSSMSGEVFPRKYSNHWPIAAVSSVLCIPLNSRKIKVKWKYLNRFESLSHFRVNFTGATDFKSNLGKEISIKRKEKEDSALYDTASIEYEKEIENMLPNTKYNIDIEPIQLPNVDIWSESYTVTCSTLPEPPKNIKELKIDEVNTEKSIINLVIDQPSYENGEISTYFIVVESNDPITETGDPKNDSEIETIEKSQDIIFSFLTRHNRSHLSDQISQPYFAAELNATSVMRETSHGRFFKFPLGSKISQTNFPLNKPLAKGVNYRAALIACISPIFNEISIRRICSMGKWSAKLNTLTTVPNFINNLSPNRFTNDSKTSKPTITSVLSGIIVTSIFIPIAICILLFLYTVIARRSNSNIKLLIPCFKLRHSSQNYYPASNSEIKENLVNPLIVSANVGSSYSNQNHDSLELKRYQISTTPDLLVQSSPSTSFKDKKLVLSEKNIKQFQHKVPIALLQEYISNLKTNENRGFSTEFVSIDHANQFSWEQSNKPTNKSKNRYANVVAYDHSRVVLQSSKLVNDICDSLDPYRSNDYINANYINGYRKQNAYIATQGPLLETINDFWRMIWEQRSVIIVMLTLLMERSRVKCEQYWPKSNRGTHFTYGGIMVTVNLVQEFAYFICRSFVVQKIGSPEKREIKHFQFTAWPDHGVPQCTIPFLMFINRIKKEEPLDSGPVVVHCSAGVGRTGVYIAVDAMLEQMKHEKSVDVYSYVTHIRSQRNYMVQTEEQYIFIHDVLLDYFQSVNTDIACSQLFSHIEKLSKIEYEKAGLLQFTGFQLEYRRLLRWSSLFSHMTPSTKSECSTKSSESIGCQPDFSTNNYETSCLMVNQSKNRSPYSLPPDTNRVILCPIRGVEGSDYFNASWIDGFKSRQSYIATQCPLKETTEDFWRMLWEQNCGIVITLHYVPECNQYWPNDRSARYQFFVVDPMIEYQMSHFVMREFKLTDARDGQSRVMRQFQFTNWIDDSCIPISIEHLLELIDQVQKTKEQFGQKGPLTVHCNTGSIRTGIFLVLSILLEKLKTDNCVNVFETFKLLKWQRPSLIESEDQYQFCFAALLEYLTLYSDENTNL